MKKNMLCAALALIGLASCNNETEVNSSTDSGKTYMQVSVKLPSAANTRAAAVGTEIGKDYENNITSLKVILVDDAGVLYPFDANTGGETGEGEAAGTYTTNPFPVDNLEPDTEYKVYVVANEGATGDITSLDAFKTVSAVDLTTSIAAQHAFMMTNAQPAKTVKTAEDLRFYTKDSPFDAGTVAIERSVARFDYKKGGAEADDVHIMAVDKDDRETTITIEGLSLINVSKTFYAFKRVSADGTMTNAVIGGTETLDDPLADPATVANYVVDYNAGNKTVADYLNHMTVTPTTPQNYKLTSSLTTKDNAWNPNAGDGVGGKYNIWTYCTENTISAPNESQLNGVTTGVAFMARIKGPAFNGTDKVYIFNNQVVGNWNEVWTSADVDVQNTLRAANASADESKHLVSTEATNSAEALAAAGFTRYTPNAQGAYYAYYTYWNQHNNNGIPTEMGTMEFAVVRNNVYKLSVSEIKRFGHPNDPVNPKPNPEDREPDPNYPDPENPDEDNNMYMKVQVEILPWSVRTNDIKF